MGRGGDWRDAGVAGYTWGGGGTQPAAPGVEAGAGHRLSALTGLEGDQERSARQPGFDFKSMESNDFDQKVKLLLLFIYF